MTKPAPQPTLGFQALTLLETVIDECVQKAVARHIPEVEFPLWINVKKASDLLGDGYPPERVKQLGHQKKIVMDRKEPEKPNSPYIFNRESVLAFSARRVFQLDQGK